MKLELKNIKIPKISLTPEQFWTWSIIGVGIIGLLGLLHAGLVFMNYGIGDHGEIPKITRTEAKLNVDGLKEVTTITKTDEEPIQSNLTNPFLLEEE